MKKPDRKTSFEIANLLISVFVSFKKKDYFSFVFKHLTNKLLYGF
jgi:hypothetical protein